MRFAHIVDGVVVNVIEAPEDWAVEAGQLVASESASTGWTYDDGVFSPPAEPPPPPAGVPQEVSRFQGRAALYLAGHLETVEAYMALPDTPRLHALAWADVQVFRRTSPLVLLLSGESLLNLTEAALDDLFTAAAEIEA